MSKFTINPDNNITVYASAEEAAQFGDATAIVFDSQAALEKVSAEWSLSRFVEIWNSIPDNSELTKFQDRKKAVARIWKAIQPATGQAGQASAAEPEAEAPKAVRRAGRATAKPAKKAAGAKQAAGKPTLASARSNKKGEVIVLMKRAKGVTLAEIMEATGWQKHTVRGFVSILSSKDGEKIESSKNAAGERVYKIAK